MADWLEFTAQELPTGLLELVGGERLTAQALVRRGLHDPDAARGFLDPERYQPADPLELPGLEQAASRVQTAIKRRTTILVWGDFDVDGQTATALLVSALRRLGGRVAYHIPVRQVESHGVGPEALSQALERDPSIGLVLTCDTGISAHPAAQLAQQRGVQLVITDHHILPSELPDAAAILNPRFLAANHPLSCLPGVGVAYMLASELHRRCGDPEAALQYLDLVALGIVADLAEVRADCRYLLQCGLRQLRATGRLGLQVMVELAGLDPAQLSEQHVAFQLAPRLNAIGRLGDANPAVELFTSQDERRVRLLAEQIEAYNARRQLLTSQVFRAALKQVESNPELLNEPLLFLSHPTWPAGVIGIVASRLVDRFSRPVVLVAAPAGENARGSARSVPGVDITAVLSGCSQLLESFGGHAMAAGFSLPPEDLPALNRKLNSIVGSLEPLPSPRLTLDGYLPLRELTPALVAALERLAPFGPGNPPLLLACRDLRLAGYSAVGRQQEHLQLTVADEWGQEFRLVWWGGADLASQGLLPPEPFDLAYTPRLARARGQPEVQIEWVAARTASSLPLSVSRPPMRVTDYRQQEDTWAILLRTCSQPGVQVWAEGALRDGLKLQLGEPLSERVRRLDELQPAPVLVIWTCPAGPAELRLALQRASPQEVVLFARLPAEESFQAFIERLAGLVKFAINQAGGEADLSRLAGSTAARENAVRLGLEWLQAKGMILLEHLPENRLRLSASKAEADPAAAPIEERLRQVLQETSAYRQFFIQADFNLLGLDSV